MSAHETLIKIEKLKEHTAAASREERQDEVPMIRRILEDSRSKARERNNTDMLTAVQTDLNILALVCPDCAGAATGEHD